MATAAEWAGVVREWRASGEKARDFAARRKLNAKSLVWWSSELRRRGPTAGSMVMHFAKVEAAPLGRKATVLAAPSSIEVVLARGRVVRVGQGFAPDVLRAVVSALEEA